MFFEQQQPQQVQPISECLTQSVNMFKQITWTRFGILEWEEEEEEDTMNGWSEFPRLIEPFIHHLEETKGREVEGDRRYGKV